LRAAAEHGFSLVELLIATLITLVLAGSVFGLMSRLQRAAGYQTEVQGVLEGVMIGMETVERILLQAGNDPHQAGFPGLAIVGPAEVRVRADLTGSAPGSPDQGDPDGDTDDSGESVTIRYNANTRSLEVVPQGGIPQPVASNISYFGLQYFDNTGGETTAGNDVRIIRITLAGISPLADPQTGRAFSLRLSSSVRLATRQ
jgi:prepilin-type N-terminal cleavage/methylation domain-containing protein